MDYGHNIELHGLSLCLYFEGLHMIIRGEGMGVGKGGIDTILLVLQ